MSNEIVPEAQIEDKTLPVFTSHCIVQVSTILFIPENKYVRLLDGFLNQQNPVIKDEAIAEAVKKVVGDSTLVYALDANTVHEYILLDKASELVDENTEDHPDGAMIKSGIKADARDKFTAIKLEGEYKTPPIGGYIGTELTLEVKGTCVLQVVVSIVREIKSIPGGVSTTDVVKPDNVIEFSNS